MSDRLFLNHLALLLNPYHRLSHLECDGLTNVIHRTLADERIEHTVYTGQVINTANDDTIDVHLWIDVEELRIDYRARMWLGNTPDIPHGVFFSANYPTISYQGNPIELRLLPRDVIRELIKPYN